MRRVALGLALAAVGLAACKGDAKRNDRGTAPTPVTTAPRGSAASTPDGTVAPPAPALATTGTTSRAARPTDALALPAPGDYRFRETITQDDGSPGRDGQVAFTVSSPAAQTVRVQQPGPAQSYYEERHDDDGLWLTASALEFGVCRWSPKSASLPRSVIAGGTVTTTSTCEVDGLALRLETRVEFKAIRDVVIAGRTYRGIDVARRRELRNAESTIRSQAIDTYVFALGLRVATAEHSVTTDDQGSRGTTRNLVLVSLPS